MGSRGPVGKRSGQRHGHRTKAEQEAVTKVQVDGGPLPVEEPDEAWHPIAQNWFRSLGLSGQRVFYEASDWATARYVAEAMSRNLEASRFSAQMFAAVMSGMSSLLTTEGDRRRVRVELERAVQTDADEEAAVEALDEWRRRLSG
ncbi:hypothetical protein ACIBCT_21170 [Streptosporangium sp. NPDC050855]|uniref:phage terminase small subunit n=1 Tax=Streptosporangium sp. NPDC050855 TaxID=3366194 RepID=UPI0037AAA0E4